MMQSNHSLHSIFCRISTAIKNIIFGVIVVWGALSVGAVNASLLQFDFESTVGFDPDSAVGAGGNNAETLVDELFGAGIGSTGTAVLEGSLVFDSNTPMFEQNALVSSYFEPFQSATVSLGGNSTYANVAGINSSSNSSFVGASVLSNGGFCFNSIQLCESLGYSAISPTGNAILIGDNTPFTIYGPEGEASFLDRDVFSFFLGGTPIDNFSPALSTPTFGDIYLDWISGTIFSKPNTNFWDDTLLPSTLDFFDSEFFDSAIFSFGFRVPGVEGYFVFEGEASLQEIDPDAPPPVASVPEPQSLWLLIFGLALIVAYGRKRITINHV